MQCIKLRDRSIRTGCWFANCADYQGHVLQAGEIPAHQLKLPVAGNLRLDSGNTERTKWRRELDNRFKGDLTEEPWNPKYSVVVPGRQAPQLGFKGKMLPCHHAKYLGMHPHNT